MAQLALLDGGQALKAWRRFPNPVQHSPAQPPPDLCQNNMLYAPVVDTWLSGDESPCLEPVDEPGDVRVIARQKFGKFVHRQRRAQLKQRPRLGRMQVKLGGSDEKSPSLLSKQSAQQRPHLSRRRFRRGALRDRRHVPNSIEKLDR